MNDNTILRIKVPAHLYEAVKAQLTLKEAKQNFGTKDMKPVKAAKAAGAASDKPKAPKKANAPVKVHKGDSPGDNIPKADKDIPGRGMTEKKELGLEELKQLAELLGSHIAKLEEKTENKAEKTPVEEEKDHEEGDKKKVEESTDVVSEYKEDPYIAGQRIGLAMKAIDAALSSGKKVAVAGKPVVSHIHANLKTDSGEIVGLGKNTVGSITIDGQPLDLEADLEKIASKYQGVKPVKGTAPKWSIPDKGASIYNAPGRWAGGSGD